MNSVLMQGMSPVAAMAGSPAPATGDFLAVLAEALAPSVSPEIVAVAEAPELVAEQMLGAPVATPTPTVTSSVSVTVPPAETARCAAIAYAATDAAADPAGAAVPTASPPASLRCSDEPVDAPLDAPADADPAAAVRAFDPTGRMSSPTDPVDDVRDDSASTDDRKDLASRQPAGVGVSRPTVDVMSPPLTQWNGRGPAEVAAAVRPAHGHSSVSRPSVHSAHGPMARPGWSPVAIAAQTQTQTQAQAQAQAQALAVRGDAASQAVGQYAAIGRTPAAQHVLPMTELSATGGARPAPVAAGALGRPGFAAPLVALDAAAAAAADAATDGAVDGVDRPAAGTSHAGHAAAVGDGMNLDRTPSPSDATSAPTSTVLPNGAAAVRPTPAGHVGAALHRTPHPGGLGMIGADRVDRLRQQTAGRPVQRLTVDLDDARVAVRVRGGQVSVDVLSDPSSTLGQTWAHDVERTLETAMRAQETSSGRLPVERERMSTSHTSGSDHRHDTHRGSGSDSRGGDQSGREQRRQVPWWLTEDDE